MSSRLDETDLPNQKVDYKREIQCESIRNGFREQGLNQCPSKRQFNENGVQSQHIILYDGPLDTQPIKSKQDFSKFKIVTCTIVGILATILVVSAFFIFAAPYIPAFRDRITQPAQGGQDIRRASDIAPTPDAKPVSAAQILPDQVKWNYWDEPMWIANFNYDVLDQVVFSFQHIIPKKTQAKYMKLKIAIRSINENPWRDFWTRIKVVNGDDVFMHWIWSSVFPRDTLVMTEEAFIVPIKNTRELRIKATTKKSNWIQAAMWIEAWS